MKKNKTTKAIVHYDTGDIFPAMAWSIAQPVTYIELDYYGESLIIGEKNFASNSIVRITDLYGKTLWSLNPHHEIGVA